VERHQSIIIMADAFRSTLRLWHGAESARGRPLWRSAVSQLALLARDIARAYAAAATGVVRAYRAAAQAWIAEAAGRPMGKSEPRWGTWLLRLTVLVLVVGGAAALARVALIYNGAAVWAPLVTGFAATALGVFLALVLERDLVRRRDREAALTETRLGLSSIYEELEIVEESLGRIRGDREEAGYLLADLPTGSWEATRSRLGLIVGDFAFMARLARFYGRVIDLQYLLRLKAQAVLFGRTGQFEAIGDKIAEAVRQAEEDVDSLNNEIVKQIQAPSVR
jgi:hypothetical protein